MLTIMKELVFDDNNEKTLKDAELQISQYNSLNTCTN